MKTIHLTSLLLAGVLACLITGCASQGQQAHESQAQLQSEAKIAKADAEKIALAKVPGGTIKEGELEREKGKLIWSFDISIPGSKDLKEVAVDALTGQVISVATETPAQQAKEKD
jgi:uncharacterized membrane protein YkoI